MCIKIPDDYTVRIFSPGNVATGEVDVTDSIPCLNKDSDDTDRPSI